MNMRETLQIDITSNRRRVCMYICMEKLKITVLAGKLSSSSEIMSKSFFSILRCVDAFHASPVYRHFYRGCNFSGKICLFLDENVYYHPLIRAISVRWF